MSQEIFNVLTEIGYSLIDNGRDWRGRPLYRDSGNNTSLSISKQTGRWVDFSACIGGNFEELVKLSLNLSSVNDARDWLLNKIDLNKLTELSRPVVKQTKIYPNELLRELLPVHGYWQERGISLKTIETFGGGLAKTGQMANRYTFPIWNSKKQIIGFIGRDIFNNDGNTTRPKYKILGNKSKWIWPAFLNHAVLKESKSVILVESPACVLRCWDMGIKNVLCLFGVKISKDLICFLLKMNFKKIIISTNNEPGNNSIGNKAAEEIKQTLTSLFDENQIIINLPIKKDVAEMNDEEIHLWNQNNK